MCYESTGVAGITAQASIFIPNQPVAAAAAAAAAARNGKAFTSCAAKQCWRSSQDTHCL